MGLIRDLMRSIWRDFEVDGVSSSGARKVRKRDIRALGDTLDAYLTALSELNALGPIEVVKPGVSQLNADLDHAAGTYAAVISINEEVAGIYLKSGSSGSGSWALVMKFTTVPSAEFAALVDDLAEAVDDVADLDDRAADLEERANYVATTIAGTADALVLTTGYDIADLLPGMRLSFRATPGPNTSADVTIEVDDADAEPVKRGNGSALKPNDLRGGQWQHTVEWTGNAWRWVSSSRFAEVFDAVEPGHAPVLFTDADDVASAAVEASGVLSAPAVHTRQIAGARAGWLRRQHLASVAHLPLCVGSFVLGQSNGLANKAVPPLSIRRSGRNMRVFNAGPRAFAGTGTPSENRERLIPHVELYEEGPPERGETSLFGSGESFCDLVEVEQGWAGYASGVMLISAASGEGSTTIEQLMEEEPLDRFMLDIEAAAAFSMSEFGVRLTMLPVFVNQGEGNVNDETPPADWKDYWTEVVQPTLEARINAALGYGVGIGPTQPLIIPQISSWNYYGKTGALALAATELCAANDKILLLPSYMQTYPDDVHTTAADQHGVIGPRVGFLQKRLVINGQARSAFAPTRPVDDDREGKFVHLQPHTWGGDDLTVDTALVRKVAHAGLQAFQSNGTTAVTIDRVWVHPHEIILKLAVNATAGMRIKYGLAGGSGSGRAAGPRGNLRTTHGDQVQVRTLQGVKPVHEWMCAFDYAIS